MIEIGWDRSRADHDPTVHRGARRELFEEARLATTGLGWDQEERQPPAARVAPLRECDGELAVPAEERYAARCDVLRQVPRAPAAETVDQRLGLGFARHPSLALRLLHKIIEDVERFGPVVGAGQTPHLRADRALGKWVKLAGLGDRLVGTQLVARIEALLGMTEQRIDAQSIPVRPLYRQPILEARGVGDLEAEQERAVDQGRGMRPIALLHQLLELVRVELHRTVQQLDDIALGREPVANVVADHANGLPNGLACGAVVAVRAESVDHTP